MSSSPYTEYRADPSDSMPADDLDELRSRASRLKLEARHLGDTLRSLVDGDSPNAGEPALLVDARGVDPIHESQRAAICRAAGMERQALHHAIRASESLRAAGCAPEARDILAQSAAGLEHLDADALELLSIAGQRISMDSRAASAALAAAEQHRLAGRFERALGMCRRAATLQSDTDDLHRCWGLTLLALSEPDSALGHLMQWVDETGGEPFARIWHTQALFEIGRAIEVRQSAELLVSSLSLDAGADARPNALGREIMRCLKAAGPSAGHFPNQSFWNEPEFAGNAEALPASSQRAVSETDPSESLPASDATTERPLSPRVFIANNVWFQRAKLSEILADEGIEVLYCSPLDSILERLAREVLPVDLILFPFTNNTEEDLELIAKIRELELLQDVPILGVSTIDRGGLDFDRLRLLGVLGLIDRNAQPEHVAFRVNNVVRESESDGRRFARAPAFFAVDLDADGNVTCEYATNLSCGGLRVASSRPLPKGTVVTIRFRLPSAAGRLIEAHGHVVWTGKTQRSDMPRHLLGVFFEPLDDEGQRLVSREVQTILSLSNW